MPLIASPGASWLECQERRKPTAHSEPANVGRNEPDPKI